MKIYRKMTQKIHKCILFYTCTLYIDQVHAVISDRRMASEFNSEHKGRDNKNYTSVDKRSVSPTKLIVIKKGSNW